MLSASQVRILSSAPSSPASGRTLSDYAASAAREEMRFGYVVHGSYIYHE